MTLSQPVPLWKRLFARSVDISFAATVYDMLFPLIKFLPGKILYWLYGTNLGDGRYSGEGLYETGNYIPVAIILILFLAGVFTLCNGYLLSRSGQTICKKLMKIQVVKMNGERPSLFRSLILREFLFFYPTAVFMSTLLPKFRSFPYIALLCLVVDGLPALLFKSRRCLHDYVAGTQARVFQPFLSPKIEN